MEDDEPQEEKPDIMTASFEGKTYVASASLQQQMDELNSNLLITRRALKFTRWFMWGFLLAAACGLAFLSWLKYDTMVMIARRLLRI